MKKIALIAGHRGKGTGAVGPTIDEGSETIWLRDRIEDFLCAKYNIVPLVDNDSATLSSVVKTLRTELRKEDICIDIHFNSFLNPAAHGSEVLIPTSPTKDEQSLSVKLLDTVCETLGTYRRGIKPEDGGQHGKLAMLSGFDCCNILLEVCFISNESDSVKYIQNRDVLAERIADLIYKTVM